MTEDPNVGPRDSEADVARINQDDYNAIDRCDRCHRPFGYAKAKIDDRGRVVHRDFDCAADIATADPPEIDLADPTQDRPPGFDFLS